jgi:hypothetical protein
MRITKEWGPSAQEASLVERWFAEGEAASDAQAALAEARSPARGRRSWFGGAAMALVLVVALAIAIASQ